MLVSTLLLSPLGIRDSLRQSNLNTIRVKAKQQRKTNMKQVIEWRLLEIVPRIAFSDSGTTGNIVGGDFNGDGNEEILFLPKEGMGTIYTPEGMAIPTAVNGAMFQQIGIWDYNDDGIVEMFRIPMLASGYMAAFEQDRTFQTEIFSLDGVILATLDGLAVHNSELVFDYNGDSREDLALLTGKDEFTIYEPGGIVQTRLRTTGNEVIDPWLPLINSLPSSFNKLDYDLIEEHLKGAVCFADVHKDADIAPRCFDLVKGPVGTVGQVGRLNGDRYRA